MTLVIVTGSPVLRRMPELGFHAAQNVIDVSAVVALSLCLLKINILVRSGIPDHHLNSRDLEFLSYYNGFGTTGHIPKML